MRFSTAAEAFAKIESFTNLEKSPNLTAREYRLDRMHTLCKLFNHPEQAFRAVHVAGSKGKGSTASFIAAGLTANGFRTGLYCSPHVETYKERISEAGAFFDDSLYAETASEMFDAIEAAAGFEDFPGGPPTTFELLTLLAFLIFRKADCEWAVFETGLGGRLDATNVLTPEASVLTIIELEHTEYLGNTIAAIAGEKAGIIKEGVPIFSAVQTKEAEDVFRERALAKGADIYFPDDLFRAVEPVTPARGAAQAFRLQFYDGSTADVQLRSPGSFQIKNASIAAAVLKHVLPDSIDPAAGFADTALPGRMELLNTDCGTPVLLDGAHTVESVTAAAEAFRSLLPQNTDTVLLFGSVMGKDAAGMASRLGGFKRIIISTPGTFKKSSPEDVCRIFKDTHAGSSAVELIKSPEEAFKSALSDGNPVLVTGSFYMVAEIRKLLK